jgi:hypothetical protein
MRHRGPPMHGPDSGKVTGYPEVMPPAQSFRRRGPKVGFEEVCRRRSLDFLPSDGQAGSNPKVSLPTTRP